MEFQNTPISQRLHISFFGCTNVGKSSLVNRITNQNMSVVSDLEGTTTDPVKKTMELLPLGPVVIIDTAGFNDKSEIGELRIKKTKEILEKTDIAVLVVNSVSGLNNTDKELITLFEAKNIKYIIAYNKSDLIENKNVLKDNEIYISAKNNYNIDKLKEKIASIKPEITQKPLISDLIKKKDIVILVIPIDESAPKGRLILPQQQVLRDILDSKAIAISTQPEQLENVLKNLNQEPKLVITDSQAFDKVSKIVPDKINLTSFSILFARYKGDLEQLVNGAKKISELKDNDIILISEACTHHRQCNDIGSVKIPKLIQKFTGKKLNFEFSSGNTFGDNFDKYSLIIHCGGCMLNQKEMHSRLEYVKEKNINIVNYGVALAYMNGILKRSIEIFKNHY